MMDEFQTAIKNKAIATTDAEGLGFSGDSLGFTGDSFGHDVPVHNNFYNSIGGRFYFERAPQKSKHPFVVYYVIDQIYEFEFIEDFERMILQFNIYSNSNSSQETNTILGYMKTLFDWGSLSISNYTHLFMRRDFARIEWFREERVWQCAVQYTLLAQKN